MFTWTKHLGILCLQNVTALLELEVAGCRMGSPISALLANLVTGYIENKAINTASILQNDGLGMSTMSMPVLPMHMRMISTTISILLISISNSQERKKAVFQWSSLTQELHEMKMGPLLLTSIEKILIQTNILILSHIIEISTNVRL